MSTARWATLPGNLISDILVLPQDHRGFIGFVTGDIQVLSSSQGVMSENKISDKGDIRGLDCSPLHNILLVGAGSRLYEYDLLSPA